MKYSIHFATALFLCFLSTEAYATSPHHNQIQGQAQGQIQGQKSVNKNINKNSNKNFNANTAFGGRAVAVQEQDASSSNNISFKEERIPVSTAYAAALAASPDTCLGSLSAGGQHSFFGLSLAGTVENEECNNRLNALRAAALGAPRKLSMAILCQNEGVLKADRIAGTKQCPQELVKQFEKDSQTLPKCAYPTSRNCTR